MKTAAEELALTYRHICEDVQRLRETAQNAAENDLYVRVPYHKAQVAAFDEVLYLLEIAR
jgi:hypothetical protein